MNSKTMQGLWSKSNAKVPAGVVKSLGLGLNSKNTKSQLQMGENLKQKGR